MKIQIKKDDDSKSGTTVIPEKIYSNVQPVWQFVFLSVLSFGIYELYWLYRNWKVIQEEMNLQIFPFLRSVFSQFFIYSFFKKLLKVSADTGYTKKYSSLFLSSIYIFIFILSGLASADRYNIPRQLWILPILNFIPFLPALAAINFYWKVKTPEKQVRKFFSKGECIFIAILGIIFVLNVIQFYKEYFV